jgi:anti-sigma factor (TIGR02949 family)
MKGCDDFSATIQIYLDSELSGQDLEDFRAHLEGCEACQTALEAEEKLSALLHRSRIEQINLKEGIAVFRDKSA